MNNFSDLAVVLFFGVMIVLCIFAAVHASLQIKNSCYTPMTDTAQKNNKNTKDNKKIIKLLAIVFISLSAFYFIYLQAVKSFSAHDKKTHIESYKKAMADLNETLTLEFNIYGDETYTTAEDLALSLDKCLPIKSIYYLKTDEEEPQEFSPYEIIQFRLKDFENHPTLINYDGTLMSVIKLQNGCKYVNTKYLGKSDCIIEVDVNNFNEPNQIGTDRVLFAIDGKSNKITADKHFFK